MKPTISKEHYEDTIKMLLDLINRFDQLPLFKNNVPSILKDSIDFYYPEEPNKLEIENIMLKEALQYLVDTKERKDKYGKDSVYIQKQKIAWSKARQVLKDCK